MSPTAGQIVVEQGFDVAACGAGGDSELQSGLTGFLQQPTNAGSQVHLALGQHRGVLTRFGLVHGDHEILEGRIAREAAAQVFAIDGNALAPAGDGQQFAIDIGRPVPVQPVFLEDVVKRQPMDVLGVGQRPVDVENDGFKCFHGKRLTLDQGPARSASLGQSYLLSD